MSRASKTSRVATEELAEWAVGATAARDARQVVSGQLTEALVERDETGSRDLFTDRLKQVLEADRMGDPMAMRAAVFELTVSGAAWLVSIDLRHPPG